MIFWREKYTHQVTTFEILLKVLFFFSFSLLGFIPTCSNETAPRWHPLCAQPIAIMPYHQHPLPTLRTTTGTEGRQRRGTTMWYWRQTTNDGCSKQQRQHSCSSCRIVLRCICFDIHYILNSLPWSHIAVSPVSVAPTCKVSWANSHNDWSPASSAGVFFFFFIYYVRACSHAPVCEEPCYDGGLGCSIPIYCAKSA